MFIYSILTAIDQCRTVNRSILLPEKSMKAVPSRVARSSNSINSTSVFFPLFLSLFFSNLNYTFFQIVIFFYSFNLKKKHIPTKKLISLILIELIIIVIVFIDSILPQPAFKLTILVLWKIIVIVSLVVLYTNLLSLTYYYYYLFIIDFACFKFCFAFLFIFDFIWKNIIIILQLYIFIYIY